MKHRNGKARRIRLGHRNIGIVLSIFLLLLVVTGVLLNHARDFGLDASKVPAVIADRYYADVQVKGFKVEGQWLYQVGESLFFDEIEVGFCGGSLAGAVSLSDFTVAACDDEIILLTDEGVVVERLGSAHGVPSGIDGMAAHDNVLVLRTPDGAVSFDAQSLSVSKTTDVSEFADPALVPSDILMTEAVTWEQFILDVHSGRYVGSWGVWLSDLIALFLAVLAISGISLSLMPRPRNCNGK